MASILTVTALLAFSWGCADETAEPETGLQGDTATSGAAPDTQVGSMEGAGGAVVQVDEQEPYGSYLVDDENKALYLFTADTQGGASTCYDACAEAWPPLLSEGGPSAGDPAVQESMLGTVERRDGSMQVTYNGWPLYAFTRDSGPGDVQGQDVHGFGGEWYLVGSGGERIESTSGGE